MTQDSDKGIKHIMKKGFQVIIIVAFDNLQFFTDSSPKKYSCVCSGRHYLAEILLTLLAVKVPGLNLWTPVRCEFIKHSKIQKVKRSYKLKEYRGSIIWNPLLCELVYTVLIWFFYWATVNLKSPWIILELYVTLFCLKLRRLSALALWLQTRGLHLRDLRFFVFTTTSNYTILSNLYTTHF